MNAKMMKGVSLMVQGNLTNVEIAEKCGVCENTIYNWLKNDEFLAALQTEQRKMFTKIACKAQQKMIELVDSSNPSIAFAAAKEILNKAGLDAPLQIEADVKNQVIFEGENDLED